MIYGYSQYLKMRLVKDDICEACQQKWTSCLLRTGRFVSVVLPWARIFYTKESNKPFVNSLKVNESSFVVIFSNLAKTYFFAVFRSRKSRRIGLIVFYHFVGLAPKGLKRGSLLV